MKKWTEYGIQYGTSLEDGIMMILDQKFEEWSANHGLTPQDVRMSCLHLAKEVSPEYAPAGRVVDTAEIFATYVLTGNKPSAEVKA